MHVKKLFQSLSTLATKPDKRGRKGEKKKKAPSKQPAGLKTTLSF